MANSMASLSLSLFVFLLILDGTAVFFFMRGFLLTRTELSLYSNCSDIAQCPSSCFDHPFSDLNPEKGLNKVSNAGKIPKILNLENRLDDGDLEGKREGDDGDQKCWTRQEIKKAVILIIDALRFDFVAHSRNFDGERKPWMNKLSVLQHLVEENNRTARMFKFIADPPTTTLQRLKGLTTGGLPTFIDVGHSFGAPAIVEDNLILQLASTGKKVIMMGDDTWMQLFPTQFVEAYPFPSFNVKDLHTVDNGVTQELFPALERGNWDVLIAHFLGVDHVGHIFGVESPLMPEKLEQYNKVIEDVVAILKNMSEPGGLFEDTLLIVMGDHGQTLNGDHGGGAPEEVETALFAWSTHDLSSPLLPNIFPSSCDLEDPVSGCLSTFPQLDFSVTLAALLGVPFPFGSVGRVNSDLYTLVAGKTSETPNEDEALLPSLELMDRYQEVLCVNSWQVRQYFEVYSKSALTGFPQDDLVLLEDLYTKAQNVLDASKWSDYIVMSGNDAKARAEVILKAVSVAREQTDAYGEYLLAAASLARSQWTQFGIEWMIVGFVLLIFCTAVRAAALYRLYQSSPTGFEKVFPSRMFLLGSLSCVCLTASVVFLQPVLQRTLLNPTSSYAWASFGDTFLGLLVGIVIAFIGSYYVASSQGWVVKEVINKSNDVKDLHQNRKWDFGFLSDVVDIRTVGASVLVALHLFSLFSNSYIVAEGLVIYFLLASSGILYLRSAVAAKANILQAVAFLALIWILPRIQTLNIFKSAVVGEGQAVSKDASSSLYQIMLNCTTVIVPLGILSWLPNLKRKKNLFWRLMTIGVTVTYSLIGLHWLVGDLSNGIILGISDNMVRFSRLQLPRIIYASSTVLILAAVTVGKFCSRGMDEGDGKYRDLVAMKTTALLAGASGAIILLMGRKGPLLALLIVLEVWVFLQLQNVSSCETRKIGGTDNVDPGNETKMESSFRATVDWSLIAGQLFFCTGHSCAFDGLHYSAAFIGFDDFGFFQQGVLLATETFGMSHFFPVIGLPLLALGVLSSLPVKEFDKRPVIFEITKGYLWFGLLKALVTLFTTASVGIQRRHLMVWGIFAPKYVFDAVGFLLVDVLIILSAALYFNIPGSKRPKT